MTRGGRKDGSVQVLIAEDETITRQALRMSLEAAGYDVIATGDGRQALDLLKSSSCQLIVTDWEMPGLTGIELCRTLRGTDLDRYVYIIMLTSHDRPADVLEGLNAGADDFVTKPFDPSEIVCRIRVGERLLNLETAEMTIFALAKLAESRDPDTGAHLERVRGYCRALAAHLSRSPDHRDQIDNAYVRLIYQTSPLHDIGKVAIPDCVLLKPGRLSDAEFEIMKTHTLHGARTLRAALSKYPGAGFLRMAHDIALTHHEHFDGTGYPNGLAGEAIPLCGRIVAVADVYDALTSKRIYKAAFDHHIARAIIIEDRGSHFDPAVVDAFISIEGEFIDIGQRFIDDEARQVASAASGTPGAYDARPSAPVL